MSNGIQDKAAELQRKLNQLVKLGGPNAEATLAALSTEVDSALASESRIQSLYGLIEASQAILAIDQETHASEVLQGISETAKEVLSADLAIIVPYDTVKDEFLLNEIVGIPDHEYRPDKQPRAQGATRAVLAAGLVVHEDAEAELKKTRKYPYFAHGLGPTMTKYGVKAFAGARLTFGREHLGVLWADYFAPHRFTDFEKRLIQAFANQAAIAVKNVRLFDELRASIEELTALQASGKTLASTLDLEQVVGSVLDELRKVVPYDSAAVFLRENGIFRIFAGRGFPPEMALGEITMTLEQDVLFGDMAREERPIVLEDAQRDKRFAAKGGADYVRAWLGVPLFVEGEMIGALTIDNRRPGVYGEPQQRAAAAFAAQAALALRNARVYDQVQRRVRGLSALREVADSLLSVESLTDVLTGIAESAREVFGADIVTLYQYVGSGEAIDPSEFVTPPIISGELYQDQWMVTRVHQGDVVLDVLKNRKPVHIPDAQKHESVAGTRKVKEKGAPPERFVVREKIKSSACIPLIADQEPVGAMFFNWRTQRQLSNEDQDEIALFANQAALALRSARAYARLDRRVKVLSALREVADSLLSVERLADMLTRITDSAREVFEADIVTLYQYVGDGDIVDPDKFVMPPLVSGEFYQPQWVHTRFHEDDVVLSVLRTRTPGYILNTQENEIVTAERVSKEEGDPPERFVIREKIKSSACIPLLAGQEPVGAMFFNWRTRREFSDEDKSEIALFANQAALAVQNARRLEHTYDELEALGTLGSELSRGAIDVDEALYRILSRCVDIMGADIGDLFLLEGDQLVRKGVKAGVKGPALPKLDLDQSVGGWVVKHRRPALIHDTEQDTEKAPWSKLYQTPPTGANRSELAVPLIDRGKVIGVLNVERREPNAFDEHHRSLLMSLAEYVAATIRNGRLAEEVQTLRELQEVALRGAEELPDVLDRILAGALRLINFKAGWLLLVEGDQLVIRAATDRGDLGRKFEFDGCVSGLAVTENELLNIGDIDTDERCAGRYQAPIEGRMKSELVVPITDEDKVIGVFNIEDRVKNAFSKHDEEILTALARQAGLVIHSARLAQETQALRRIQSRILSGGFDEAAIFKEILDTSLELIGSNIGQLLLRDGSDLVIAATTGQEIVGVTKVGIEDSVTGLAIKNKEPINVPNVQEGIYKALYKPTIGEPMLSELAVPLLDAEGNPFGVLNTESRRLAAFGRRDEELLQALAAQAAITVRSARLYKEIETLRQIDAEMLKQAFDLDNVLQLILDKALELIGAQFGQVLLVDEGDLVIRRTTGAERVGTRVAIDGCVSGVAVLVKGAVNADLREEPYRDLYKQYLGEEMLSELVVPMGEEEVIGVINIESRRENAFDDHDVELLEALAGQAALAVRNAQQYERERAVVLGQLAADLVHRMNTPLAAIRSRCQLLRRRIKDIPPDVLSYLEDGISEIEENVEDTLTKVDSLRQRAGELGPTEVRPLIQVALEQVDFPDTVKVEPSLPDTLPRVFASRELVNVFRNLFNNAVEAMPDGGQLSIEAELDEGRVQVAIRDTGHGIPEKELQMIFEPWYSGKGMEERHGLGLWWTRQYLQFCGGAVDVQSQLEVGTTFVVHLPIVHQEEG